MKRLWRSRGVNVESFAIPKLYEHLGIVVFGKQVCISVGKDIIRSLGRPSYICIRINSAFNSVLFKPCEEHDPMSFKVPEKLLSVTDVLLRFIVKCLYSSYYLQIISTRIKHIRLTGIIHRITTLLSSLSKDVNY